MPLPQDDRRKMKDNVFKILHFKTVFTKKYICRIMFEETIYLITCSRSYKIIHYDYIYENAK